MVRHAPDHDSTERVAAHTDEEINELIARRTDESVLYHAQHPDQIEQRLRELEEEWDVERSLEAIAAGTILAGLTLSILGARRWLLLSITSAGFLLQHAIQGWCPPLAVIRRQGVRTRDEILREHYALRTLRGDFNRMPTDPDEAIRNPAAVLSAFSPR